MKQEKEMNFKRIEKKWQKKWEEKKIFEVSENKKKKFSIIEMFPYPSGSGLHMGHAFNYVIGDIYARFKRMNGFNVLYPMGYDSLGLPAENAAIKEGKNPREYTENSIKKFIRQQKELGLSYDWTKLVKTHDYSYYKWDQWIFLKMLEKRLAYRKKASVNFCRKCNTVLANEQVHNGKCWRHEDTDVEIRHLEQWFFKITDYADELYEGIEKLKGWNEDVKAMQRNWIGKSYGTEIEFDISKSEDFDDDQKSKNKKNISDIEGKKWPIFTTRPDTIYGVTFMVVSSQHPKLMEIVTEKQKKEVERFLKKIKTTSEKEQELEKEGVFTGSYAINPITGEKIPIYAGNFVIADYGSGMVMAVPAHDERDFEFAKKYNIPVKIVIQPKDKKLDDKNLERAYTESGILVNSGKFNGMENKNVIDEITKFLEEKKLGKKTVNYKLRDWLVSRQRYWGTPIPIIYCGKCGIVPVPEKDLPVKLPEKVKFGEGNPLESARNWIETKCPKCKGKARRETDTMDTFVNSSWYFLRYCDSKNEKKIFDEKKVKYWMPIDLYIGGKEHACMHLIYFRFYTKFLRDLGLIDFDEPTLNLFNQGMVHGEDGAVMSKSRGNVVLPEEVSEKYGIDTARIYLVSMASPDKDVQWSENGIEGSFRFVKKIVDYFLNFKAGKSSERIESKINKTIKEITGDIENLRYNLAIIKLRALLESLEESPFYERKPSGKETGRKEAEIFLKLLHPFAPHITEELWEKLGNKKFLSLEKFPLADESKINEKFEQEEKAIKKLIEDINNISRIVKARGKEAKKAYIYCLPKELEIYKENEETIKNKANLEIEIYAVNDKNKHDPENKALKAKPEKPAIYLE